jgi:hypothetical protein
MVFDGVKNTSYSVVNKAIEKRNINSWYIPFDLGIKRIPAVILIIDKNGIIYE